MKKYLPGNNTHRYIKCRLQRIERHKQRRKLLKIAEKRKNSHSSTTVELDGQKRKFNKIVKLPKVFNFTENYRESMKSIDEIRNHVKRSDPKKSLYVDFDNIHEIGVGAALVLASEFDVANIERNKVMKAYDNKWKPAVRGLLHDIGFYQLLDLQRQQNNNLGRENPDEEFLRFCSGQVNIKDVPEKLIEISNSINNKFADGRLPNQIMLNSGISEAVLNTQHHAYLADSKNIPSSKWWISASLNRNNNEIKIICYDRGQSIPNTLNENVIKSVKQSLSIFKITQNEDSELIRFAMEKNTTSSKRKGRGNGLPSLREFIDNSYQGRLLILSRKGRVEYSKLSNGDTKWNTTVLPTSMLGTLIVWSIILEQEKK